MSNDGKILLPASELTVPTTLDRVFLMRHADWLRIRGRLGKLDRKTEFFVSAAWAVVGIGVSAILSLISWFVTDAQMPPEERTRFAWMAPALLAVTLACLVLSIALFLMNSKLDKQTSVTVDLILEDMDAVYEPVAKGVSGSEAPETSQWGGERDRKSRAEVHLPPVPVPAQVQAQEPAPGPEPAKTATAHRNGWSRAVASEPAPARDEKFAIGDEVKHLTFGRGHVVALTGRTDNLVVEVVFVDAGYKRLSAAIAPMWKVSAEAERS